MYMSLCKELDCYVCCGGVGVYNDGMCCDRVEKLGGGGNACTCANVNAPATRPNVTGLRVKVASRYSPAGNYSRPNETQHGGRTGSNSQSMVSMEDEALPLAKEVACG